MKLTYKTKNINKDIKKDISAFLKRLEACDYIEGIVLLGGLGKRNFSDKFSDIDISLFYNKKIDKNKHLPFEFHYKITDRTYEFNIRELYYQEELKMKWDESKKEAYANGIVILDKKERIQKLINQKTKYSTNNDIERLIYIMQQYIWRGQIHTIRSYHRGYPEGAHLLLNECIELLLEAIYIINEQYQSHLKWRFSNLIEMDILPKDALKNFRNGFLIKNHSIKDIQRRIKSLNKIYYPLKELIEERYPNFPKNPYVYTYRNKKQRIPVTFSQKMKEKYKKDYSEEKLAQLEGKICFTLCDDEKSAKKLLREIT